MVEWDDVGHRESLKHGCYLMLAISYLVIVDIDVGTPIRIHITYRLLNTLIETDTLCSQQHNLILTVYA